MPRELQRREKRLGATLGAAARLARMRAALTQAEVAASMGVATEVYGRIERGVMLPSVPTLFRLCVALSIGPHELMGFAPMNIGPQGSLWGAGGLPPRSIDSPEMRRLFRILGRLEQPSLKLVSRLVASLLPA